jgi:aryl-alcohol dehydrogenase-like predicted oxidoreductase
VDVVAHAPFGRTGHESSRVIFGAAALASMRQQRADEILDLLLAYGVDHIDVAASYGDAELRVGAWMPEHRDRFFLATKTGGRSGSAARAELERSLERLGVDHVDLIQLHNLVEPDECVEAFAPDGAVAALAAARDEGLTRFIGVTGHGLRIPGTHIRSLAEFDFDSVLYPYNFSLMQNDAYRADVDALRAMCRERNVAMQTIKSIARGRWPDPDQPHFSWYEPLTDGDAIARAVHYVLGNDDLFLNTSSDARLLPLTLEAAEGAVSLPSDDAMRADADRLGITPLFADGALERI